MRVQLSHPQRENKIAHPGEFFSAQCADFFEARAGILLFGCLRATLQRKGGKMKKDGKTKLVVLIIALGIGWFGCFLTTREHPEVGVFLLFTSLTSLSRLAPAVASRALAVLALGAWYLAFPDRGREGQTILLPILTGGSAFLTVLLLREIVDVLLEGGEGGGGGKEKGKK
jgi:hypothetical protein